MKKIFVLMLVVFVLSLTLPASASDMGLKRLGGKVGIIFPEDLDMGFMLGAAADVGEITDNLNLVPLISYWNAGEEEGIFEVTVTNIQIGADVQYYIENVKGLYFGGGLSVNFKSATSKNTATNQEWDNSETDIGIGLLGGYELPIGKTTTGFAHLKYNIISDLNTFAVVLGVWFDMKK